MNKNEYIKSRCNACGLCDGNEYHQHHCPDVDEISAAWDVSKEECINKACNEVEDILYQCKRTGIHSVPQLITKFKKTMEEE